MSYPQFVFSGGGLCVKIDLKIQLAEKLILLFLKKQNHFFSEK